MNKFQDGLKKHFHSDKKKRYSEKLIPPQLDSLNLKVLPKSDETKKPLKREFLVTRK